MTWVIAFIATVPLANWMIGTVGTVCVPDGPCLIPVWPGIMAPSGVLVIGGAFVLRDLVQRRYGARVAVGCILAGAALSGLVAPADLAAASAGAFLVSEGVDCAIYTWLQRHWILAVCVSSLIGIIVDSALFLWLAFGSLTHLEGQIIGKLLMVVAGVVALACVAKWKGGGN